MKYYVIEKETKSIIDEVENIEDGKQLIELIEKHAKEDGTYTENAFDIVRED